MWRLTSRMIGSANLPLLLPAHSPCDLGLRRLGLSEGAGFDRAARNVAGDDDSAARDLRFFKLEGSRHDTLEQSLAAAEQDRKGQQGELVDQLPGKQALDENA